MYLREKCRFLLNVKIHAKNFFGGVHQKHGASRQCVGRRGRRGPEVSQPIAKGGPVTVAHPKITRLFMTIPEAARSVLQASSVGRGGGIFILDMGSRCESWIWRAI